MRTVAESDLKALHAPIFENGDGVLDKVGRLVLRKGSSESVLVRLGKYSNDLELEFRYYRNCVPIPSRRKIYGLFRHRHERPEHHSSVLELLNHLWQQKKPGSAPWEFGDHDDLLVFGIGVVSKTCHLPVVAPGGRLGSHVSFIACRGDKRCLERREANWPWNNGTYFLVTRSPAASSRWTGF